MKEEMRMYDRLLRPLFLNSRNGVCGWKKQECFGSCCGYTDMSMCVCISVSSLYEVRGFFIEQKAGFTHSHPKKLYQHIPFQSESNVKRQYTSLYLTCYCSGVLSCEKWEHVKTRRRWGKIVHNPALILVT